MTRSTEYEKTQCFFPVNKNRSILFLFVPRKPVVSHWMKVSSDFNLTPVMSETEHRIIITELYHQTCKKQVHTPTNRQADARHFMG